MTVEMMQNYAFKDGMEKGKDIGLLEGLLNGKKQKAEEDAVNLLKEGDSIEKVSRCIGLPLEKVRELAEGIKK